MSLAYYIKRWRGGGWSFRKNMKNLSDGQLVLKSLEEVDCFAFLMGRYEGPLRNYILRISSFSYMEAEEILQEVFLKVWKNLLEFDQGIKFSSWIYRIAHNETISSYRKAKSRGIEKRTDLDEDLFHNLPSKWDVPKALDQHFTAELIREILDSLPDKYRGVLVLRYYEDKSYDEISDILKKPSGTVSTLLNRAKKAFLDALELRNISFE